MAVSTQPGFTLLEPDTLRYLLAVHTARSVAADLLQLHARGWAHRDVKPGNILFSATGQPHEESIVHILMTQVAPTWLHHIADWSNITLADLT